MLNFVKRLWSGPSDPIAYQLPLAWFDQQLPGDLLATGLHWVWESSRGGRAARPNVPEHRLPAILTQELAPDITAELGEYEGDLGRAFIAFATALPMEMRAAELVDAIRKFANTSAGPLQAILYQEPEGPSTFFVGRTPPVALIHLLETWAARLGKPVDGLEKQPKGGAILERIFLDPKTAHAVKGLP